MYTIQQIAEIFEAYKKQLHVILLKCTSGGPREVGLDTKLLFDFTAAGLNAPGFSMRQKTELVELNPVVGPGFPLGKHAETWPFLTLTPWPDNLSEQDICKWLDILNLGLTTLEMRGSIPVGIQPYLEVHRDETNNMMILPTDRGLQLKRAQFSLLEARVVKTLLDLGWKRYLRDMGVDTATTADRSQTDPGEIDDEDIFGTKDIDKDADFIEAGRTGMREDSLNDPEKALDAMREVVEQVRKAPPTGGTQLPQARASRASQHAQSTQAGHSDHVAQPAHSAAQPARGNAPAQTAPPHQFFFPQQALHARTVHAHAIEAAQAVIQAEIERLNARLHEVSAMADAANPTPPPRYVPPARRGPGHNHQGRQGFGRVNHTVPAFESQRGRNPQPASVPRFPVANSFPGTGLGNGDFALPARNHPDRGFNLGHGLEQLAGQAASLVRPANPVRMPSAPPLVPTTFAGQVDPFQGDGRGGSDKLGNRHMSKSSENSVFGNPKSAAPDHGTDGTSKIFSSTRAQELLDCAKEEAAQNALRAQLNIRATMGGTLTRSNTPPSTASQSLGRSTGRESVVHSRYASVDDLSTGADEASAGDSRARMFASVPATPVRKAGRWVLHNMSSSMDASPGYSIGSSTIAAANSGASASTTFFTPGVPDLQPRNTGNFGAVGDGSPARRPLPGAGRGSSAGDGAAARPNPFRARAETVSEEHARRAAVFQAAMDRRVELGDHDD
jgi:hypothetical protein